MCVASINMQPHSCTKLLVFHLPSSVCQRVRHWVRSLWPSHLPQQIPVEPSLNTPPFFLASSGRSPVSLSHLLPSSYSTDHACSKNRSHFHPRHNLPPSLAPPLFCVTSFPNPSPDRSSCPSPPSHLSIAPPRTPPSPPQNHVLPWWNLEACVSGVSTNPEPFAGIKL